jgi:uridylate kinase
MDNGLPIVVFDLFAESAIARATRGEKIGTLVSDQLSTPGTDRTAP